MYVTSAEQDLARKLRKLKWPFTLELWVLLFQAGVQFLQLYLQ